MTPTFLSAAARRRRLGLPASLVIAAYLASFGFGPVAHAQSEPPPTPAAQPKKPPPKPQRQAKKKPAAPDEPSAEELNRRWSERNAAEQAAEPEAAPKGQQASPPSAAPTPAAPAAEASPAAPMPEAEPAAAKPPIVYAGGVVRHPDRMPAVPPVPVQQSTLPAPQEEGQSAPPRALGPGLRTQPLPAEVGQLPPQAATPGEAAPVQAQAQPPQQAQSPQQPPRSPTPVQPRVATPPPAAQPQVPTAALPNGLNAEARGRQLGRNEAVPTEAPAIQLEVNKGTIVRLRSAASTVFIANPDIADVQVKSPTLLYLFARKPGDTVLYAVDDRDRVLLNAPVVVSLDASRLRSGMAALPGADRLTATANGDTVIVGGSTPNPATANAARQLAVAAAGNPARVVNNAAVTTSTQINLRVRIAEASRDNLKRFGFNWEATGLFGSGASAGLLTTNSTRGPGGNFSRLADPSGGLSNAIFFGLRPGSSDINGLIDALSFEGVITVLAEPNLTAMSGETASFLAGGEFPILLPGSQGSVTVDFKRFGVSLSFTPTLVTADRVNLKVRPEVSSLSTVGAVNVPFGAGVVTIPALTTRRAETTVELGSGQSFAIAGLIQNQTTNDISRVPGLGDVPVLGALFKSDRFRRQETELVIIVTPYLVQPTSGKLVTPVDGFVAPTDGDRILHGRGWRQQPTGVAANRAQPAGGFVLD